MLACCRFRLTELGFYVMHRVGITHQATDKLSRQLADCHDTTILDDALSVLTIEISSDDSTKEVVYIDAEELDHSFQG